MQMLVYREEGLEVIYELTKLDLVIETALCLTLSIVESI